MSNLITDSRRAIQDALATAFPDAEIFPRRRTEGRNERDVPVICVWWPGWNEVAGKRSLANTRMHIRHYPPRSRQPDDGEVEDPEPLEQAAVDVAAALNGLDKVGDLAAGVAWHVDTATVNDDPAQWYAELTLIGWTLQLATGAA